MQGRSKFVVLAGVVAIVVTALILHFPTERQCTARGGIIDESTRDCVGDNGSQALRRAVGAPTIGRSSQLSARRLTPTTFDMTRRFWRVLRVGWVAATIGLEACDLDPFGLAQRPVVGRVALEAFEGDSYYLHVPESSEAPEGQLNGHVRQLAWDSTTVLVERDTDYVVVDVRSGLVRGPLNVGAAQHEPLFAHLAPAAYAWHQLPMW